MPKEAATKLISAHAVIDHFDPFTAVLIKFKLREELITTGERECHVPGKEMKNTCHVF
jgi:hypothetical protein